MSELFRAEAVEHQQQRLLGTVVLTQTWMVQAMSLCVAVLMGGVIVVLAVFGFARREALSGLWMPEGGLSHLTSTQPGVIEDVMAKEGQWARRGEALLALSAERHGDGGPTSGRVGAALSEQRELLTSEIGDAQRQIDMRRAGLIDKLRQVDEKLARLKANVALQKDRAALAAAGYQRFSRPEYSSVVSLEKLDEKRVDMLEQQMRLLATQSELGSALVERKDLALELEGLSIRAKREVTGIMGSLNNIRQAEAENDTRHRWQVRAPKDGRVTLVAVKAGQSVASSEVLMSLAPADATFEAVLFASSRAAGQLRVGMPAQVRFASLPYQKFGQFEGLVTSISTSPVAPSGMGSPAAGRTGDMPLYRVHVQLQPGQLTPAKAASLKAGMQLDATITLEHRRFYEWIAEPLIGASRLAL